ncbi:MAG: hypothetical protein HYT39_01175 [Candidatus Sungbacteria bacterium]|nr:hypothetical protein [Candidatus Sungbacteria bacterium]
MTLSKKSQRTPLLKNWLLFFILAALVFGIAKSAVAQTAITATSTPSVSISAPFEVRIGSSFIASVRLSSGENPAATFFSWFLNNALQASLSGQGKSVAQFTAPKNDDVMVIKVNAKLANGAIISDSAGVVVSGERAEAAVNFGQNLTNLSFGGDVNLSSDPESPRPLENVEISARSFLSDLNTAQLRWLYNGKEVAKGRGLNTIEINAGPAGKRNLVALAVTFPNGREVKGSLSFITSDISFYWWADTYAPAWYPGKALPTAGATIHIQARPSFPDAVSQSFTYTWLINDEVVRAASGPGKSIFNYTVPLPPIPPDAVSVRVSNLSGTIANEAVFTLPAANYELLAYEEVPLQGINAASVLHQRDYPAGKTLDILLEPFFVPKTALTTLKYEWNLNGRAIPMGGVTEPRKFMLNSKSDATGVQRLSVSLQDTRQKLLRAFKSFEINLK